MTDARETLAGRLHKTFCGDDGLASCPFKREHEVEALAVLAYVREQMPTREEIAEVISDYYGRLPDGRSRYPSTEVTADAILALLTSKLSPEGG